MASGSAAATIDDALKRVRDSKILQPEIVQEAGGTGEKKRPKKPDQPALIPEVINHGREIVLPEGMSIPEGIIWLLKKWESDSTMFGIHEEIDAMPLDGAYALAKAIARVYGFSQMIPTPSFFGSTPPTFIAVKTGVNETVQVPWGRITIPGVTGHLETSFIKKGNTFFFVLGGEVQLRHKDQVAELAALTRKIVQEESIYRGKALRVNFLDEKGKETSLPEPEFIDLSDVHPEELIFSRETERLLQYALFTPIENTEACRAAKVPLKRGVLLSGPYGGGKTLTANVCAKKAVENGWTFTYLKSVNDLAKAIAFAARFQPAIIFAEDIDTVVRERDDAVNEILNTIDGVDTKSNELMVVLTTNHVENIHGAMLRPGRLDVVLDLGEPDAEAVQRLLRVYGRGLIAADANLTTVGEHLAGNIPATVRECVERAKLAAISHTEPGEPLVLLADDLEVAARTMLHHLSLIKQVPPDERSDIEKAAAILVEGFAKALGGKPITPETAKNLAETLARAGNGPVELGGELPR